MNDLNNNTPKYENICNIGYLSRINQQKADNQYPFWGLWRNQNSSPLPKIFYPNMICPISLCTNNDLPIKKEKKSMIYPNWALTK